MGSSAQSSAVLFERREHNGIITLNRPEAMNAVNARPGKRRRGAADHRCREGARLQGCRRQSLAGPAWAGAGHSQDR